MKRHVFFLFLFEAGWAHAQDAQQLLDQSSTTGGVVVHLNCGEGKLLAEIVEGRPAILVHGLDPDSGNVAKARETLRDSTRASVE
ncbi:MAG: class I SAM-dependent methyltransferase [Verrucomicrobiota bacterium]